MVNRHCASGDADGLVESQSLAAVGAMFDLFLAALCLILMFRLALQHSPLKGPAVVLRPANGMPVLVVPATVKSIRRQIGCEEERNTM